MCVCVQVSSEPNYISRLVEMWHGCVMTSSNENIFRVTGFCERNPPLTGGFPSQRPVTRNSDVFFDLCLNKWLSKHSTRQWFETPCCSLWHRCNDIGQLFTSLFQYPWKCHKNIYLYILSFIFYLNVWWRINHTGRVLKENKDNVIPNREKFAGIIF